MDTIKLFISYAFADEAVAARLTYYLRTQPFIDVYFYREDSRPGQWDKQVRKALDLVDVFLFIAGGQIGATQGDEAEVASKLKDCESIVVGIKGHAELPLPMARLVEIPLQSSSDASIAECASKVIHCIGNLHSHVRWVPPDGLPTGYPFDYEKDLIDAYTGPDGPSAELIEMGCPRTWPDVDQLGTGTSQNPLEETEIGDYREGEVMVDARSRDGSPLTFLEAGPRRDHLYPRPQRPSVKAAIVVSGGIAPGINAVIASIVERHRAYAKDGPFQVLGYQQGLKGLWRGDRPRDLHKKTDDELKDMAKKAGSLIGTSRFDDLLMASPMKRNEINGQILDELRGINILYVVGGDGSMRAAHALAVLARQRNRELSVVGIPKTMDNDIMWVWQSFGFVSAVEMATQFSRQLHAEASSNPRLCVMQLFGSDSGFVVSHAALASGVCDYALIPEVPFELEKVAEHFKSKLQERRRTGGRGFGVIMMAETAIPTDVAGHLNDPDIGLTTREQESIKEFIRQGRRVRGQTPDELRTGGLKVVSRVLQKKLRELGGDDEYWQDFRVFTSEPRHLLRAMRPSSIDVTFARRLGTLAVDNAMAGYTDFMVSQWLTEYVLVPLKLVVLGRKRVPQTGIFWKSVIANTGQPRPARDQAEPPPQEIRESTAES